MIPERPHIGRTSVRVLFATVVVGLMVVLLATNLSIGQVTGQSNVSDEYAAIQRQATLPPEQREPIVPPRNHTTVITSHLNHEGELIVLGPEGRLQYYDDSNTGYWDVDPSPHGNQTITYTTADEITDERSGCERPVCIRTYVEEANLTTGETSVVYSRIYPGYSDTEWHDADWIDDTHLLVGGISEDRVFIVNTTSGLIVWQWEAENHYELTEGRSYPQDWTHLNDVEYLDDGRVMASLRGMDEVVFIDQERGVQDEWTLGEEGNHEILNAQHNPDYIPRENGGPAALVADSDNNRVVEYQRTADGTWNQSWVWQDARLQWARDADRLPNGHTLITDTHGNRVIEVDESGAIVWQVDIGTAYEAERLETGDESTGGPSAVAANLQSRTVGAAPAGEQSSSGAGILSRVVVTFKSVVPPLFVNALSIVLPRWISILDLLLIIAVTGTALVWGALEFRWSSYHVRSPIGRNR